MRTIEQIQRLIEAKQRRISSLRVSKLPFKELQKQSRDLFNEIDNLTTLKDYLVASNSDPEKLKRQLEKVEAKIMQFKEVLDRRLSEAPKTSQKFIEQKTKSEFQYAQLLQQKENIEFLLSDSKIVDLMR